MRPWVQVKLNPGSERGRVPLDPGQKETMGFLSPVCFLFFFLGGKVYCQYESYQWDEDYDQETDDVYQPEFHFHQNVDYRVPFHPHALGCASECFCPPNFPLSMYCDHRKLQRIPNIPAHIQQVYLQFNEIEAVTADSFINATHLKEINLSHNKIKSQKIDHGVFAKLSNLLQLQLQHNNLEEFPFPLPKSLERLLLGYNMISRLQTNAVNGLVNLTMLDLCYNHLDDSMLQEKHLAKMEKLMQLNLFSNELEHLPPGGQNSTHLLRNERDSKWCIPKKNEHSFPFLISIRKKGNKNKDKAHDKPNLGQVMERNMAKNIILYSLYLTFNIKQKYIFFNNLDYHNQKCVAPTNNPIVIYNSTSDAVLQIKENEAIETPYTLCCCLLHTPYWGCARNQGYQTISYITRCMKFMHGQGIGLNQQSDIPRGMEQCAKWQEAREKPEVGPVRIIATG
ncbi:hypothetical protein QTO34_005697 [Cnephaeus nilssonii]|uniref:Osteomodulin n=1 Tax=Cnephaeus nilssonii TaxID=3371016 RepID=A0AA40HNU7_CNENI|nr:hypothetical protein QTO34_005697 [Eptesicus nilssonii]